MQDRDAVRLPPGHHDCSIGLSGWIGHRLRLAWHGGLLRGGLAAAAFQPGPKNQSYLWCVEFIC